MRIGETCEQARSLLCGDRLAQYGDSTLPRAVAAFNVLTGQALTIAQACLLMRLIKESRELVQHKPDNMIDLAGYADLQNYWMAHEQQTEETH